jgi:glycosyltransferase involved in cell wall biosynthesis
VISPTSPRTEYHPDVVPGLVTTIIPVFNRPDQLREAVASVLSQDHGSLEVLIVDDGSTDNTWAVAQELAASAPNAVHALSQENGGPGAARERGRLLALGEFIQYLDSDDVLLPGKFKAQVAALNSSPECHVAYGMTRFRHADGTVAPGPWKGSGSARATMFPSFLVERWWDTPNPLYRRQICDAAGPWTGLRLEEDWEYDCRVASLGARLVWCNQYVCEVRDHAGERLCRGTSLDPSRLRQRALSHELILSHATAARLSTESSEMQQFSRSLFLLARQLGAAGLPAESRRLFALARRASGEERARGLDYRLYGVLASALGWSAAGKAGCWFDKFRSVD